MHSLIGEILAGPGHHSLFSSTLLSFSTLLSWLFIDGQSCRCSIEHRKDTLLCPAQPVSQKMTLQGDGPSLIVIAAGAQLEAGEGGGLLGVSTRSLQVDALKRPLILDHHLCGGRRMIPPAFFVKSASIQFAIDRLAKHTAPVSFFWICTGQHGHQYSPCCVNTE